MGGGSWASVSLPHIPSLDYRSMGNGFLVAVGVVLAVLASFVTCVGLNLQKLSLCQEGNENVSPWQQPRWLAGFLFVVVGSLVDFMAFGLAPQSLLAPLAALSMVWNLFIASYMHDERYTAADLKAVALIVCGTGFTVLVGSHEEREFTLDQLMALYREPRMAYYGTVVPLLLVVHYGFIRASQLPPQPGMLWLQTRTVQMLGYAGFAGIVGGQSVLFAKSTMELIKDSVNTGEDVFFHIETYIIIGMTLCCLLVQITFLNGGLKAFDSLLVVPAYQSYWIVSGEAGGAIYFGEVLTMTREQLFAFFVGTVITLFGLYVLTTKEHHSIDTRPSFAEDGTYLAVSPKDSDLELDDVVPLRIGGDIELPSRSGEAFRRDSSGDGVVGSSSGNANANANANAVDGSSSSSSFASPRTPIDKATPRSTAKIA